MRKSLILLIILIILSPLGILLVWNYGSAYAEWDHIGSWYPQHFWNLAPLQDYNVNGWDSPLMASLGYIISAIVGVTLIIIVNYGLMRLLKHG
ncbi:MAG: PDGLE domain-containing protein [Thermoplasmata archaeon]|jgi:cobalt/nickel transport protein